MGLSTALFNAVSGLSTLSQSLNVIGDNLANVNTIGFKASNALFQTVFSQTLVGATAPTSSVLGTNPIQLGLGVRLGAIKRSFGQGSLNATGSSSDLALQGRGFFILSDGVGQSFTRDGSFAVAVDGTLVDPSTGLRVQGWQAVDGVVTPTGSVGDIVIPVGISIVRETSNALLSGNLDASGAIATTGTVTDGPATNDTSTGLAATAATLLTNLENTSAVNLGLAAGDTITITGTKGGADIAGTFSVTGASTLGDLAAAIQSTFGIVNGSVTVDADGSITITGDPGTGNAIADVELTAADGTGTARTDFNAHFNPGGGTAFTEITAADGESFVLSGLNVFDSLGNSVPLTITFTRTGPNTVSYLAESPFGTPVGSGTITYDTDGQFVSVDNAVINIDRSGTGAATPLDITLDFSDTTLLSGTNTLALSSQDGFPIGSLEEFFVGANGVITGGFSNGLSLVLGQVALAVFANQEGLLAIGDNQYVTSANSGDPVIGEATTGSRGAIVGGFLEGSNTDLATEFTNIIIAQRGFQANARTITAADVLLEEVISLVR
ncbi:MAG: flagellar hook-basal body complex protein [Candidatus Abyssobacteria bacterium SURF_17]|uniref:Flagellar hook protein FlgE n=1 Tax=Candidatus Abyssobacteria bacterium SURF_17 TaxID=2093361 RepID=A0A419F4T3_9BACT|nr:MAG: flagellar hook-basal body complex protein [Candidatus Abyssubacteria bacterium SURF_17]